jgi:DNA polymerase-3 subunit delta'
MNNITKIIEIDDIYSFEGQKNIVEQMCTHLGFVTIENHPDILNISKEEKNSIGIKEIQHLTKWISTKPYNHTSKVVFISHGDLLTHEAQNSLLKITEEPPPYANIFILVNSHKNLLETIVSRSEVLNK